MTRRCWLAVLVVCVVCSLLRAEDAYTVKLKENAPGDVIAVERIATLNTVTRIVDAAGKPFVDGTTKWTLTEVYKETILEREMGKRPTKLTRQYEKAEVTEVGHTRPWPYQGKTVLIVKKDGAYHFQLDGDTEELSKEDAALLEDEFNDSTGDQTDLPRLFLPAGPVALNEGWKIDTDLLVKELTKDGAGVDADKTKGTAVLTKAYKMGGQQYGVLHCEAEASLKSVGDGTAKITSDAGVKLTYQIDMDACIDGRTESGTIKAIIKQNGSGVTSLPMGGEGKITFSVENTATITRHEQPKK